MESYFYNHSQEFKLESGGILENFNLAYCTSGRLNEDKSNVIWVCHPLTKGADVMSWWSGLFGKDCLFNPEEHYIICVNLLGSCHGSTGALSNNPKTKQPYFHDFPFLTIRDIVYTFDVLRNDLGIEKINTLIGGSMGGQLAMEWAVIFPDAIENLVLLSSNAVQSAWGVAFNEAQRMAITADPSWKKSSKKAGVEGLKAARAISMLSYRNYETFQKTQTGTSEKALNDFKAASYLQYKGEEITQNFNAYSYWTLSKAMDSHNIGRGRGGVEKALSKIKAYTQVTGIVSDLLFPIEEQRFLTRHIPNVTYEEFNSTYGHDGFLIEVKQLENSLKAFFKQKERKQI